jgi:hypothetical protein
MHSLNLQDVTSVRVEGIGERSHEDGKPYAVRKLVIGTRNGMVEIDLFTRLDTDAPKDAAAHRDALAVRDLSGNVVA